MSEKCITLVMGEAEIEVEELNMDFPTEKVPCRRCGEERFTSRIGNGLYCSDCAADIWKNVGGQPHE